MASQKLKTIYLERMTAKLSNLTPLEKERMDCVTAVANQLMKQYGLEHLKFDFCHSPGHLGLCHQGTLIEIDLFYILNASDETVRNLILHEIAHALVGPGHGHREHWQNKARELGVTWERRYHK